MKITRFGRVFEKGGKCPACSSSRDTGGRLELKKRKNFYLKCKKCKYAVKSEKVILAQIAKVQKLHDKEYKI